MGSPAPAFLYRFRCRRANHAGDHRLRDGQRQCHRQATIPLAERRTDRLELALPITMHGAFHLASQVGLANDGPRSNRMIAPGRLTGSYARNIGWIGATALAIAADNRRRGSNQRAVRGAPVDELYERPTLLLVAPVCARDAGAIVVAPPLGADLEMQLPKIFTA